jgi:hypothetical protein
MQWQNIPADRYFADALALSNEEHSRLQAALAVLPDNIVDTHTHISRPRSSSYGPENSTAPPGWPTL